MIKIVKEKIDIYLTFYYFNDIRVHYFGEDRIIRNGKIYERKLISILRP